MRVVRVAAIGEGVVALDADSARGAVLVILEATGDEATDAGRLLGQVVEIVTRADDPRELDEDDDAERRDLLRARGDAARLLASVIRLLRTDRPDVAIDGAYRWLETWADVPSDLDTPARK